MVCDDALVDACCSCVFPLPSYTVACISRGIVVVYLRCRKLSGSVRARAALERRSSFIKVTALLSLS